MGQDRVGRGEEGRGGVKGKGGEGRAKSISPGTIGADKKQRRE